MQLSVIRIRAVKNAISFTALSILTCLLVSTPTSAQAPPRLTNGTTADAESVMAHIDYLQQQITESANRISLLFGQSCPPGESITGFSSAGNLLCSGSTFAGECFAVINPVYRSEGDFDRAYIEVANSGGLSLGEEFTLEAWVKLRAYPPIFSTGSGSSRIIQKRGVSGDNRSFALYITDQGFVVFDVYTDGTLTSVAQVLGQSRIFLNEWTHIAVTSKAGVAKVFVNGQLDVQANFPRPYVGTKNVLLGGGDSASRGPVSIDGYLDMVRVSSVARYTESFTPPTASFSADASTLMLFNFDNGAQNLGSVGGNGSLLRVSLTSCDSI